MRSSKARLRRMAGPSTWMLAAALATSFVGCNRNNIEAVNLANEGDQVKGVNLDEAISKYEQATQLDPTNHRILWKLALTYHKKEAWSDDALACSKAEKIAPTFANYFFEHGYALEQQAVKGPTSWTEAKAPLEEAIKLDPNMGQAYEELAEVQLHIDDEQGALQNYTKAIETQPDQLQYYGPLADLYLRLSYREQAEKVLTEALPYGKPGDKHLFVIHSLLGSIYEAKGNLSGAVTEYESAKQACNPCTDSGQQIAFFNLGAAYAQVNPPRKTEAVANLQNFSKIVCKGAAAQRYADQCQQAQEIARRVGGTLQ